MIFFAPPNVSSSEIAAVPTLFPFFCLALPKSTHFSPVLCDVRKDTQQQAFVFVFTIVAQFATVEGPKTSRSLYKSAVANRSR